MKLRFWFVFGAVMASLLASCASVPPAAFFQPGRSSALVNLALDRSVVPLGEADDSGPGMLTDRNNWQAPLAAGSERWAEAIRQDWTQADADLVDWTSAESQKQEYSRITRLPDEISSIGFLRPDAVRYFTPQGWNYIAPSESSKWAELAASLGVRALWSVTAVCSFVVEDTRPSEPSAYHVVARNIVRLFSEGKELGRFDVMSYSQSHRLTTWTAARRELPTSLEEAGHDFVKHWVALSQKVN